MGRFAKRRSDRRDADAMPVQFDFDPPQFLVGQIEDVLGPHAAQFQKFDAQRIEGVQLYVEIGRDFVGKPGYFDHFFLHFGCKLFSI